MNTNESKLVAHFITEYTSSANEHGKRRPMFLYYLTGPKEMMDNYKKFKLSQGKDKYTVTVKDPARPDVPAGFPLWHSTKATDVQGSIKQLADGAVMVDNINDRVLQSRVDQFEEGALKDEIVRQLAKQWLDDQKRYATGHITTTAPVAPQEKPNLEEIEQG